MEGNRDYSKECGIRCRQIRMSKGMSQQALAEKINVTPAAISKWEKEGISNIDYIMTISNVLGQDITSDQFDQEGALGEVGKEILRILIEKGGYEDFENLEHELFGMKADRISNELFKLERIGTAIREQYKDFSGDDRDGVFITAKGVIAYKNTVMFPNAEQLNSVVTMDERLEDRYSSFQDIIDSDRVTKYLMGFSHGRFSGFRCDYIKYLFRNYFNPIVEHAAERNIVYNESTISKVLCGESCYIDILRRMAQGTNVKEFEETIIEDYLVDLYTFGDFSFYEDYTLEHEAAGLDENNMEALRYFCNVIECMPDYHSIMYNEEDWLTDSEDPEVQDAIRGLRMSDMYDDMYDENELYGFSGYIKKISDNEEAFFGGLDDSRKKNSNLWFTEQEIRKYIEGNILEPTTEEERMIDEGLRELWKTDPEILEYYNSFPKSWEDNGLAQLIRDRVGVPAID